MASNPLFYQCLSPSSFSRGPRTGKLLTPQRNASSAACPGRALPRHALLPLTAACGGRRERGENNGMDPPDCTTAHSLGHDDGKNVDYHPT